MMGKNKFLLLSLEDKKAQKIANAINNKTSKQILDILIENDSTQTELSKKLNLPISTIHYNLKLLLDAKLIEWEESHFSEKGKEVKHYKLANQYIIIAPKNKDESNFLDKIKTLIPTFTLILIGSFLINIYSKIKTNKLYEELEFDTLAQESEMVMAKTISYATEPVKENILTTIISNNIFWFILGSVIGITIYLIIEKIRKR